MKSIFALLACAGAVSAQSLTDVLVANNATLSTLTALVKSVPNLLEGLSNAQHITILAPTNDAFNKFVAANNATLHDNPSIINAILSYHVLNTTVRAADVLNAGSPVFARTLLANETYESVNGTQYLEADAVNGNVTFISGLLANASVITADVNFTGGVVHVIDTVLTLPVNINQTAVAAGLTSLAGALTKANLLAAVDNLANITVFAPSNRAFQNINSALTNITTDTLTSVLEYHVVNGSVLFSTDLADNATVKTLGGGSISLHKEGSNFFVNGALISEANVLVSNGVVHVIDQVLNPGNTTALPGVNATAGTVQFTNVTAGSSAPLTSGIATASSTIASRSGTAAPTTGSASSTSSGAAATMKAAAPFAGALLAGAAFLI